MIDSQKYKTYQINTTNNKNSIRNLGDNACILETDLLKVFDYMQIAVRNVVNKVNTEVTVFKK